MPVGRDADMHLSLKKINLCCTLRVSPTDLSDVLLLSGQLSALLAWAWLPIDSWLTITAVPSGYLRLGGGPA